MYLTQKLAPRQKTLQLQVGRTRIPRILLGTSPFIGAGQFGARAAQYYSLFGENPTEISKMICRAFGIGFTGIQALSHPSIYEAIKLAEENLEERIIVIGTVGPEEPSADIKNLQDFETEAMLLHGQITDERNIERISKLLEEIRLSGCLAGLATHSPYSTLMWLLGAKLDFDILMMPFNRLGMFMDADPLKIVEVVKKIDKPIIGKKILAAGRLQVSDALNYVVEQNCIDIVALGVASEREAEETFEAAMNAYASIS